jgi:uncharacterized protein
MTVVIDCNILVMCLASRSPYHGIYQSIVHGKFNVAVTIDIMLEYEEVIQQKYGVATARALIALLSELPNVRLIHPHYQWQLIETDVDDNKYCDCAIAGQAAYIVTEDRHFAVLKNIPFPSLTVISIDDFVEMLQGI